MFKNKINRTIFNSNSYQPYFEKNINKIRFLFTSAYTLELFRQGPSWQTLDNMALLDSMDTNFPYESWPSSSKRNVYLYNQFVLPSLLRPERPFQLLLYIYHHSIIL